MHTFKQWLERTDGLDDNGRIIDQDQYRQFHRNNNPNSTYENPYQVLSHAQQALDAWIEQPQVLNMLKQEPTPEQNKGFQAFLSKYALAIRPKLISQLHNRLNYYSKVS